MQIAQVLSAATRSVRPICSAGPWARRRRRRWTPRRSRFASGAAEKGVDPAQAGAIFELVAKFAGYGFNKSHAAAYALVSLPDRLAEGEHAGGVLRLLHEPGPVQHRQAGGLLPGRAPVRREGAAPPTSTAPRPTSRWRMARCCTRFGAVRNVGFAAMEHVAEVRREGGAFSGPVRLPGADRHPLRE